MAIKKYINLDMDTQAVLRNNDYFKTFGPHQKSFKNDKKIKTGGIN